MPRWIILAILLLVVLGRCALFVVFPEPCLDVDQAIVSPVAKHLPELRPFPGSLDQSFTVLLLWITRGACSSAASSAGAGS